MEVVEMTDPAETYPQSKILIASYITTKTYPDAVFAPQHTKEQLQLLDCDAVAGHDSQHVHQKV